MSEFPWSGILALMGVGVGFLLYQVADFTKDKRKKETIKKALSYELTVAMDSLYSALNNKNRLPKNQLPLITEVYDASKQNLASILKPEQLHLVQWAYTQIRQVSPIDSQKVSLRGYQTLIGDEVVYIHDLNEQIDIIRIAIAELIK